MYVLLLFLLKETKESFLAFKIFCFDLFFGFLHEVSRNSKRTWEGCPSHTPGHMLLVFSQMKWNDQIAHLPDESMTISQVIY